MKLIRLLLALSYWFWYCYDDSLAHWLDAPAVGGVWFIFWFVGLFLFGLLRIRVKITRS